MSEQMRFKEVATDTQTELELGIFMAEWHLSDARTDLGKDPYNPETRLQLARLEAELTRVSTLLDDYEAFEITLTEQDGSTDDPDF